MIVMRSVTALHVTVSNRRFLGILSCGALIMIWDARIYFDITHTKNYAMIKTVTFYFWEVNIGENIGNSLSF